MFGPLRDFCPRRWRHNTSAVMVSFNYWRIPEMNRASIAFLSILCPAAASISFAADEQTKSKDNTPPEGFTALFNGKDLEGWKGLLKAPLDNPIKRAALAPADREKAQKEADDNMRAHWKAEDGALVFDGKGRSICTAKD